MSEHAALNHGQGELRVAIFMTSHFDERHVDYLTHCWQNATYRFPLLQHSDLILYTSGEPPAGVLSKLRFHSITIKRYNETIVPAGLRGKANNEAKAAQKQDGARNAMIVAYQQRWFDGYDWIIRLNPDVLIRNDTWIRKQFQNTSAQAILLNHDPDNKFLVHSDFYAFRPGAVDVHALFTSNETNTERHVSAAFRKVIERNAVSWLRHGQRAGSFWRTIGPKSPVVHSHRLLQFCPDYFTVKDPKYDFF